MECLICQDVTENGCLTFCGAGLCSTCEMRLLELKVGEPGYDTQIHAFRLLWQRRFLGALHRHQVDGEQA